jgi:vitamin B12 transporter
VDEQHPIDLLESSYRGRTYSVNWKNTLPIHESNKLVAGVEYQKEEGESSYYSDGYYGAYDDIFEKQDHGIASFYAQDMMRYEDRFFGTVGIRYDDSDRFDGHFTFRLTGTGYPFNRSTKLSGSVGTGFKAPSLFQLYSAYGSEDLDPEKSTGFDIGIEQFIDEKRVSVGLTYFYNTFEDMIDFDTATYSYMNIAEARTQGIEIFTHFNPAAYFTGRLWYTYTDTEDETTGEDLLRRPRHKFGLSGNVNYPEKLNITPSIVYVGKRDDLDFGTYPAARAVLDSYVLCDVAAAYDVFRHFQAFFKVNNLFDQQYKPVLGYDAPGIGFFAGLKISK